MVADRNDLTEAPGGDTPSQNAVDEARSWALRVTDHTGLTSSERAELVRWLGADRQHALEYRAELSLILMSQNLPASERARICAAMGSQSSRRFNRFLTWPRSVGFALVVLALVGIAWFFGQPIRGSASYTTQTGELRTVRFADGSVAVLDTRTRLVWVPMAQERRVILLEGQAFFQVAHDAGKPFRVEVDGNQIQAIGTQFNVYRKGPGTLVLTVLEGEVEVAQFTGGQMEAAWRTRVHASEQFDIERNRPPDLHEAGTNTPKWRQGSIEFHERSLQEVVTELERYTDRPIRINDPHLAQMRVGGLYSTRDIETDLLRISKLLPMRIRDDGASISLDARVQGFKEAPRPQE